MTAMRRIDFGGNCRQRLPIREPVWFGAIAGVGMAIWAHCPPVGDMGPKTTWEDRSRETGLPLVVNNRTGREPEIDFSAGQSAVSASGQRLYSFSAPQTRVFYVDWDGKHGFSAMAPQ